MNYYARDDVTSFLEHHGIKGQKWGVRRFQNKDGTLTAAGKIRYSKVEYEESETEAILKDVGSMAFTAAIVTGATMALRATIDAVGDKRAKKAVAQEPPIEKLSDVKRYTLDKRGFSTKDLKRVNTGHGKAGTVKNCQNCVSALEMRFRGYDVRARKAVNGDTMDAFKKWYKGVKVKNVDLSDGHSFEFFSASKRQARLDNYITSTQPKGARGVIGVVWQDGPAGHVFNYCVGSDGKVTYLDGQARKSGDSYILKVMEMCANNVSIARLDNCEETEKVMETCTSWRDD